MGYNGLHRPSKIDESQMTQETDLSEVPSRFDQLIRSVRVGILITMNDRGPFGSHVPFLLGENWSRLYIHISGLAQHTQNLKKDRRISLFVTEPDEPQKNPLSLQRINLQGKARPLTEEDGAYQRVKADYIRRFPQSKLMFGFADFSLWELQMNFAHFVAGFGAAYYAHGDKPTDWIHQKPKNK
jgi:putative heme iron utilization protein